VSGTGDDVGGVVGRNDHGSIIYTWYATTDAAGKAINGSNASGLGTAKTLAELQTMPLGSGGFGFDSTAWRTNATDGSTALVATTPMLQAFKSTALDSAIAHTAVQYGTAEKPLTNIYRTSADLTLDMSTLTRDANMGVAVYGHNLTVNNFTPTANDTSFWGSYAAKDETDTTKSGNLVLQNDNGFTINKDMQLVAATSITLSAKDSATGTIIDYGKNITPTLIITAKNIVLDTDRVDTAAGNAKTTVTLNAAGTAKAGYTPTGTMTATVNGASVSVPDYATTNNKRTYYPAITVKGDAAFSEGQWIKNVNELQAMGTNEDTLKKTYFLYGDIDASATKTWNQDTTPSAYQGFMPVGNVESPFTGIFDGLNHTVDGLYINLPAMDYVGLFGRSSGAIQNIGLVGDSITGHDFVGGVAGLSMDITNVYNTGTISGQKLVGGITGSGYDITDAYNTGTISGGAWGNVGGVAGYITNGTITNAYNTGTISGGAWGNVGGVVGNNSEGTITNVYNTGAVSGGGSVGGVAGENFKGTITNVYNTGAVSGTGDYVGGVAGQNYNGTITNALWANDLKYTLAEGYKKPAQAVGNMADTATVKGAALADMKKAATYSSWGNDGNEVNDGNDGNDGNDAVYSTVAASGNAGTVWRIYEGDTTPLLTSFFKGVVTVTGLSNQTVTYNGTNQTADLSGASYSPSDIDSDHIYAGGARDTGSYSAIYSDQQGYDLVNANTLTITPVTLTATLTGKTGNTYAFTKTYDGTNSVTKNLVLGTTYTFGADQVISGDTVSIAANSSGIYADKDVADGKTISYTGITLTGADASNYKIASTLSGDVGQITKKDLTVALLDAQNISKVYDGTTTVTAALVKDQNYSLPDLVSGDAVTLTASGTYDNKNAGTGKQVSFTNLGLTGTDAGNYNLKTKELGGAIGQIDQRTIAAEIKSGSTFAKEYDGTDVVTTALVKDTNYVLTTVVSGDDLSLDTTKISGTYTPGKDVGDDLSVIFTGLKLTGKDAGNYDLLDFAMGENYGKITPKALTATLTGDNAFTKVYDGTTTVNQALGTNYALDGIVADSDKVSLSAGSGAYNDKNAGDNKTITFSGLTLTGTGAGNYTIASTLSGAVGQITRKTITGSLASGYSFDKTYDGTTTAKLGNGYTLNGVVAGDTVPLTAAKGFYDSSAMGDRTVTFSGFSINDGNYLLSMADSLSGTGKITSGSQDHNYSDALTSISSFFGANPSDGYTIFSGSPEDYIPRAVTKNNGQSYQVGVTQVTQTWYNGPATITIINGGITLPRDILLGSTYDTRTVVIKGKDSYQI